MASTTLTLSQLSSNVVATHTGICLAGGTTATAPASASTVLNLCKVPQGATIVDWWFKAYSGGANQTVQVGTSNTPSGVMAVASLSATFSQGVIRAGEGGGDLLPVRVSLSDDVQPANVWLQARCSAAHSSSALFTFCTFYTMDGFTGHAKIR